MSCFLFLIGFTFGKVQSYETLCKMLMFLARQVRVSQKPRQRITKYLPTKKNGIGQEEISGAASPRQHQQKETSLLPFNRHVRSVEGTWLVFTCLEGLRTILPSLSLGDGCTYLPDPRTDLGEGDSIKESLTFPTDAFKCALWLQLPSCRVQTVTVQRNYRYNCRPHRAGGTTVEKRGAVLQICDLQGCLGYLAQAQYLQLNRILIHTQPN